MGGVSQLTRDHVTKLTKLYEEDDRTGMYLEYYALTGSNQALDQATISSFSGYTGAIAECANDIVARAHPDLYPKGGVIEFSKIIAGDLLQKIVKDVQQGGTGIFTDEQIYQFARQKWTELKMGGSFPGNILYPKYWLTEGTYATLSCAHHLDVKHTQAEMGLNFGKAYGKSRSQFTDLTKYQWLHMKPHGKDISYAIDLKTGKHVFLERSKFGYKSPSVQAAQIGAASGLGLGLVPSPKMLLPSTPLVKKPKTDLQRPSPSSQQKPVEKFLKSYGLSKKDINPQERALISKLSNDYAKQRPQFSNGFPFEFFGDAFSQLRQLAQATNNPKLMQVAQVGGGVVNLFKQLSALPGILSSAPTALAALNPILGIATAIFSLTSLFKKKKGPNPLAPLMKQLQGISDQVAALHRDVIKGFNMLAEGQQKIFTTMVERFHRLEDLVRQENEKLSFTLQSEIAKLQDLLGLIHSDLSLQLQQIYLLEFENLNVWILNAISSERTEAQRKQSLEKLLDKEVPSFENWLMNKCSSGILNGGNYVSILKERRIPNVEILINNRLLNEHGVQLESFTAYLGQIAKDLLEDPIFSKIEVGSLINPLLWLGGCSTYVSMCERLLSLELVHDTKNSSLEAVKKKGLDYIEFIIGLQRHSKVLFEKLLKMHRQSFDALLHKVSYQFIAQQIEQVPIHMIDFFKSNMTCTIPVENITKSIDPSLHPTVLKFFTDFQTTFSGEEKELKRRFTSSLERLIACFAANKSFNEIVDQFNVPLTTVAHHRSQAVDGVSCLNVNHGGTITPFEKEGFKLPFLLNALVADSKELKSAIPKICCLAELLGLGHFEMTVGASLAQNEGKFIDPQHLQLNNFSAYLNYRFSFEVFFVQGNVKTKLGDFDCLSDQLPISETILNDARLVHTLRERMDKVPPYPHTRPHTFKQGKKWHTNILTDYIIYPPEFVFLDSLIAKINALSQAPNLKVISRSSKVVPNPQWEKELTDQVQNKLNQFKTAYFQFYLLSSNQSTLNPEFDGINSSRNLILAFMHLCGLDVEQINTVRQLWSHSAILSNAAKNVLPSNASLPDPVNNDKAAQEALKKCIDSIRPNISPSELIGYQVSELASGVQLVVENDIEAQKVLQSAIVATTSKGYLVTEIEMMVGLLETIRVQRMNNDAVEEEDSEEEFEEMQTDPPPPPQSSQGILSNLYNSFVGPFQKAKESSEQKREAPDPSKNKEEEAGKVVKKPNLSGPSAKK